MNFRYPHDPKHPVRKYWVPWWVVAWRLLLFPFIVITVWVLIIISYLGWGRKIAREIVSFFDGD